jgi:hypothetical protein
MFLDLPGELRNMTYGHVFGHQTWTLEQTKRISNSAQIPGLLRTCCQIYSEAKDLAYSLPVFSFIDAAEVIGWCITRTGSQIGAINSIELRIGLYRPQSVELGHYGLRDLARRMSFQ